MRLRMKYNRNRLLTRRFSVYNALYKAIGTSGVSSSGSVATLLLEMFLEGSGRLVASTVYAQGLCDEKQFRDWRKNLIEKGWLVWNESQTDKGVYFPGKKLLPYINKEKLAQKEIATRESVEKVRSDLSEKIDTKADFSSLDAKADRSELAAKADRSELEATKARLEETNRAMAKIADAVRDLQEAMLPPDDEQKRRRREMAAREIARQSRAN
jgi:hypothetical protein